MTNNSKKRFENTKVILGICVVLMVVFAASSIWFFVDAANFQKQISNLKSENDNINFQLHSANFQIKTLNSTISSLNSKIVNLENQINSLEQEIEALTIAPKQYVVDELEGIFGFDVTFVYFGNDETLTYGAENAAVVAMLTNESVTNFVFSQIHEQQFDEGKKVIQTAYPYAEVFVVCLMQDLNNDSIPDASEYCFIDMSGGGYGGRTETALISYYWENAEKYVLDG